MSTSGPSGPLVSLHIFEFTSKSNGSIYYFSDCIDIFVEKLSVLMNISKKARYPFSYFQHF